MALLDNKIKGIVGQKFGRLTVVGPTEKRAINGAIVWKCLCTCGRYTTSTYFQLSRPRQDRSCGKCVRPGPKCNLEGKKFGLLTAIRPTEDRSTQGDVIWIVKCQCGKRIKLPTSYINRKPKRSNQAPKSCGCYRKRNRSPKYKGVGDLSSTKFRNMMARAKQRKIPFEIDIEYAWSLFVNQNKRCVLTGVEIKLNPSCMEKGKSTASLDRIDSSKGYVRGNVQWVHVEINYMKHSLHVKELVKWCHLVADYDKRNKGKI